MHVVFIVGPTASGKSAVALQLAQEFRGAVINCDSVQVYKHLDIGSAKPSQTEQATLPHFLYDIWDYPTAGTAGRYSRDFFDLLTAIETRFQVVFVVGGTGFYFQAIEKGMFPVIAADPVIRGQISQEMATAGGSERLFFELQQKDPVSAEKISPNDHYRLERAIEVIRSTGKPLSEIKKEFLSQQRPFPYPLLKLGVTVDRESLRGKIRQRVKTMLELGLVQEVKALIDQGFENWEPLQSVGYKEALSFLRGEIKSQDELLEQIVQSTSQLAKRQRTWFKRDLEIHWAEASQTEIFSQQVRTFLKQNNSKSPK